MRLQRNIFYVYAEILQNIFLDKLSKLSNMGRVEDIINVKFV